MKEPFPKSWAAATLLRGTSPQDFPPRTGLYLVALSELPQGEFSAIHENGWAAYTSRDLDSQLAPILRRRRLWHGRGFATVVDDRRLADDCGRDAGEHFHAGLGIAIHEAGHYIAWQAIDGVTRAPSLIRGHILRMQSDRDFDTYWARTPNGDSIHGAVWIRATVHLHHRVQQCEPVNLQRCRMRYPGFPDVNSFRLTLATELNAARSTPLQKLLREPPPRLFIQLWNELCSA